jgi:hypothetical protein
VRLDNSELTIEQSIDEVLRAWEARRAQQP